MKALLIIDMQVDCFTPTGRIYDAEGVVRRINAVADFFRGNRDQVIYIQHDGSVENYMLPGTPAWEILPTLMIQPEDVIVSKKANSAFYKTKLQAFLKSLGIDDITITGNATDFCVEATVQAALFLGYGITIIKDAHTTADRPHANAKTIIDHYNWVWENLTPTGGKMEVIAFENYMAVTTDVMIP